MSSRAGPQEIVRRYRDALNGGTLALVDDVVAVDVNNHSLPPGLPPGLHGFKLAYRSLLAAFPDLQTTTQELICEGDCAVERFVMAGTHKGSSYAGISASNASFRVSGTSWFRIADSKIVELWTVTDDLSMMQQLGLLAKLD